MALYPVILAGGSGARLWPLSRALNPKQFLAISSERSLLQETLLRLDGLHGVVPPVIVCNEEHRFLVAEHCRQTAVTPSSIILEPDGRNTAPALTLAALHLADRRENGGEEDPVMLVMPSDHILRDVPAFQAVVSSGFAYAQVGCMVAVGIVPTSPNTGYGYIEKGEAIESLVSGTRAQTQSGQAQISSDALPFRVASFVEKPDRAMAQRLLSSGRFLWNSGIFMSRTSVWLEQMRRHRPDIAEVCRAAHARGRQDGGFYRPHPETFAVCPGDFVAYSIMEKVAGKPESSVPSLPASSVSDEANSPSPDCVVIPLEAGWSDVGSWSSLWEEKEKDESGNVIMGDVYARTVRNSLLIGRHKLVAAVGLENVVVVETGDAVLVAHMDYAQEVRAIVEQLKAEGRPEH